MGRSSAGLSVSIVCNYGVLGISILKGSWIFQDIKFWMLCLHVIQHIGPYTNPIIIWMVRDAAFSANCF